MLAYQSPLAFSGAGTQVQALGVAIRQQCMAHWCWASVTELVSALLEQPNPRSQCEIASKVFDGCQCCPCPYLGFPGNGSCDSAHDLGDALGDHFVTDGAAVGDFATLVTEICTNQRPVGCRVALNDGSGFHYVVVIGVAVAAQLVRVADPLQHDGNATDLSFATFCAGYSDGIWDQTITIR